MQVQVVKIGGAVVEEEDRLDTFLDEFSQLARPKILVHGGGRGATDLAAKLGVKSTFHHGRRITSKEMLDVVLMSYSATNQRLVSKLQTRNQRALGLSGVDLGLISADKRPIKDGLDFGYVGDIKHIHTNWLGILFSKGITPVISPITSTESGQLLNTNADTIASQVAIHINKHKNWTSRLLYCFEKVGVLADSEDNSSLISKITRKKYKEMKETESIHSGMIPKLDNGFSAVKEDIDEVRVLSYKDLTSDKPGTLLSKR